MICVGDSSSKQILGEMDIADNEIGDAGAAILIEKIRSKVSKITYISLYKC